MEKKNQILLDNPPIWKNQTSKTMNSNDTHKLTGEDKAKVKAQSSCHEEKRKTMSKK
jgi:hypothetical protein